MKSGCSAIPLFLITFVVLMIASGCSQKLSLAPAQQNIASTPTQAQTPDGAYISWTEHLIDGEDINGGVPIRGGDGLKLADLDADGYIDIISVHEDSDHLRIAFGTDDPNEWVLTTVAFGEEVNAIEDVALGDLNRDGWIDIVAACERGHLIYLQNPGRQIRRGVWARIIPSITKNRGSWLRVFMSDLDGDGMPEVLAANKGGVDVIDVSAGEARSGVLSVFKITSDPLDQSSWVEMKLWDAGVPNTAMPIDIDRDGDVDILTGSRLTYKALLLVQSDRADRRARGWAVEPIEIAPGADMPPGWRGRTNVFHAADADLDADARTDLVMVIVEDGTDELVVSLGWLRQPARLSDPWRFFTIGDVMPDVIVGFAVADIDNDGDLDVMAGGYSGLNVLDGGYSGAARDHDDPDVTAASSVGRITWFQNTGNPYNEWIRHDISRRIRGMYDEFIPHDMDGDGDIDFVATRGNSGEYDGVFWLEQVRSDKPRPAFEPARQKDSRQLPLPPEDWRNLYDRQQSTQAPKND
ncbi:MAG: VCBS repeat-containing protein [Alphaproteobacteria bacterium]|nr:VCBS repeat-containing protein [Alphaproteobacteria bacterium]